MSKPLTTSKLPENILLYLTLLCGLRYNLRICDLEEKGAHTHSKSTATYRGAAIRRWELNVQ